MIIKQAKIEREGIAWTRDLATIAMHKLWMQANVFLEVSAILPKLVDTLFTASPILIEACPIFVAASPTAVAASLILTEQSPNFVAASLILIDVYLNLSLSPPLQSLLHSF